MEKMRYFEMSVMPTKQHGVTSQKTVICLAAFLRTLNLAYSELFSVSFRCWPLHQVQRWRICGVTPPLSHILSRHAQARLIDTALICEGRWNWTATSWLWQLAAFYPVFLHVPSAPTCAAPFDLGALFPAMSITSVLASGISRNILQVLITDDVIHTRCIRPIALHLIQQFAHSVINYRLTLMILLRVSSSKGSSSGRYKQRHRSTSHFVKDVHVRSWNTILLITVT